MIIDPWGLVLAQAPDTETAIVADLDFETLQRVRRRIPALAHRRTRRLRLEGVMAASGTAAADKRRMILDAAMRVFARQGFHTCRVSDIADEAGVAYGLVYHYFSSKDEILDTLFLERWNVMLAGDRRGGSLAALAPREAGVRSPGSSSTPTATSPS